jgi:hypothetical protein
MYRRRGGGIDAPIGEVALYRCGIALGRRPVTVTISTISPTRKLPAPLTNGSTPSLNRKAPRPPVWPPSRPQGGVNSREPFEAQVAFGLVAVHPPQSHAAARPAGAARALHQLIAQHRQRVFDLERLDRQARGVGHVHVHSVEPILSGAYAGAAAGGFEIDPEVPILLVDARKARCRAVATFLDVG